MKQMTGQQDTTIIKSTPDFSGRNPGTSENQARRNDNLFTQTPLVRRKRLAENMARGLFLLMTLLIVIPLILIVCYLFYKAFPVLSIDFLFTNPERGMRAGGIWSALLGTIYLVVISLFVSAPIGVLAAVYLNEYSRDNWLTRIINLAVVNLAGVPSIVHALFGVGAFVLFAGMGRSILAASLTLAIMTLPVIIAATKEALGAVPMAFREACWNVGATRWQTIRRIVLPNSISGILTGIILQVSRAAGETAPIMFTGAVFYKAISEGDLFAYGLFDQCMALSMHLFTISTQVPNVPEATPYGTAVVLLGTVLMVNMLAIIFRVYLRSRKKW
jgi:phosphate transport system permease protein